MVVGYVEKLASRISRLKRERRAVILGHNYQDPYVQEIADFLGDSLELARKAMSVDADVIVFAGVSFMAEMAAILNPNRIVLHPEPSAGCPLADHLSREVVDFYRRRYPDAPLVIYINSHASVKAISDYIVTSSSAVRLVSQLDTDTVLFGPDRNLASYVAEKTDKEVVPVPNNGHCPVHEHLLSSYHVRLAREIHPNAKILAHPEVRPEVRRMADFVGSTSQMLKAVSSLEGELLIGTEEGLSVRVRRENPGRKIFPVNPGAICIDMKKINLENIEVTLREMGPRVKVDKKVAYKVREVLMRSLDILR